MINLNVHIRSVSVVTNNESTWIGTHASFINWWNTDPVDGAMVFKQSVEVVPVLEDSFSILGNCVCHVFCCSLGQDCVLSLKPDLEMQIFLLVGGNVGSVHVLVS